MGPDRFKMRTSPDAIDSDCDHPIAKEGPSCRVTVYKSVSSHLDHTGLSVVLSGSFSNDAAVIIGFDIRIQVLHIPLCLTKNWVPP